MRTMQIKVNCPGGTWYLYSNVLTDSNINGMLAIVGKDEDGPYTATFKPGEWEDIEVIMAEERDDSGGSDHLTPSSKHNVSRPKTDSSD